MTSWLFFYAAAAQKHKIGSVETIDLVRMVTKAGRIHRGAGVEHLCYLLAPP